MITLPARPNGWKKKTKPLSKMVCVALQGTHDRIDLNSYLWDEGMNRKIIIFIMSLLMAGCVYVGKNFDESKLTSIHKGETTRQEVVGLFGEPTTTSVDSEGNELMMWSYSIGSAFGADAKVLSVKTHDGKVESYSVSKSKI